MTWKKLGLGLLGLVTLPLFLGVCIADRLLLSFLVWTSFTPMSVWINDDKQVVYSFVRVLVLTLIIMLITIL